MDNESGRTSAHSCDDSRITAPKIFWQHLCAMYYKRKGSSVALALFYETQIL